MTFINSDARFHEFNGSEKPGFTPLHSLSSTDPIARLTRYHRHSCPHTPQFTLTVLPYFLDYSTIHSVDNY